ncbi:MAG: DegV family protein [Lachnospiraceae bacterium]|nr:DegV family protein [Lachnospiraceae bacterium]
MGRIIIMSDSTCDLSADLIEKYGIEIIPLCIIMDEKSYFDGIDVTSEEIIEWSNKNKTTPKTAAAGIEEAIEKLRPHKEAGDEVIFIGISEDMSTTCNVIRLAADELEYDKVYVINSMNLSTGIGLQVIRAAEMVNEGKNAEYIYEAINGAREDVRASFVVDTLTFLARGGRCTAVTALLANTLQLKPRIEVKMGKMGVGTKYRGKLKKVLINYVDDMKEDLLKADKTRVFVTYSVMDHELVEPVVNYLKELNYFDEILETQAGGVITSHCGPSTLGVLFYAKGRED